MRFRLIKMDSSECVQSAEEEAAVGQKTSASIGASCSFELLNHFWSTTPRFFTHVKRPSDRLLVRIGFGCWSRWLGPSKMHGSIRGMQLMIRKFLPLFQEKFSAQKKSRPCLPEFGWAVCSHHWPIRRPVEPWGQHWLRGGCERCVPRWRRSLRFWWPRPCWLLCLLASCCLTAVK